MTNGEKIKEIFPNGVLTSGGNNSYYWGDDIHVSKEYWNAEYIEPTTKNNLKVDCIKKSDAINIIQDMHGLARADVISDVVNRIIAMPSVIPQEPRWIPVSERLPEKSGYYWCTFGGTNLTGSDYYTTESDAKEIYDEPEEYVGWRSQNVIAWMPKPKPYREVKNEIQRNI